MSKDRKILGELHTLLGDREIKAGELLDEALAAGILRGVFVEKIRGSYRRITAELMLRGLESIITTRENRRGKDTINDAGADESMLG